MIILQTLKRFLTYQAGMVQCQICSMWSPHFMERTSSNCIYQVLSFWGYYSTVKPIKNRLNQWRHDSYGVSMTLGIYFMTPDLRNQRVVLAPLGLLKTLSMPLDTSLEEEERRISTQEIHQKKVKFFQTILNYFYSKIWLYGQLHKYFSTFIIQFILNILSHQQ